MFLSVLGLNVELGAHTHTELTDLTLPELTFLVCILGTCVLHTLLCWSALHLCIADVLWRVGEVEWRRGWLLNSSAFRSPEASVRCSRTLLLS